MPIEFHHTPDPPPPLGAKILEMEIPSQLPDKDIVLDALLRELRARSFLRGDDEEMKLRLVLDEALVNAIKHGNKFSLAKKVRGGLYETDAQWSLKIEDEGEGFSPRDVPDPDDPESLLLEHGRGIVLMKSMMDDVRYYRGGSCLVLVRKKGN
jgi:serine/threonine-protein kinase RsbW